MTRDNKTSESPKDALFCYFCVEAPAVNGDHVPSRESFHQRIWPEGFEFPACENCNRAGGRAEQVVALHILLADHEDRKVDTKQFVKLLKGVQNNDAETLRFVLSESASHLTVAEAIQILPASEIKIAVTPALREAFDLVSRRLACALYYKEVGQPLPRNYYIATAWVPIRHTLGLQASEEQSIFLKQARRTNRQRKDLSDQFRYDWRYFESHRVFSFKAFLSRSFIIRGHIAPPERYSGQPYWRQHASDR